MKRDEGVQLLEEVYSIWSTFEIRNPATVKTWLEVLLPFSLAEARTALAQFRATGREWAPNASLFEGRLRENRQRNESATRLNQRRNERPAGLPGAVTYELNGRIYFRVDQAAKDAHAAQTTEAQRREFIENLRRQRSF